MDRKRLDINDYPNASDEFKKDVAFANDVLDKVYAKIGEQSQSMLDDAVKAKPTSGFVHSTENIAKPKSNWFASIKGQAARNMGLPDTTRRPTAIKINGK